MYNVNYLTFENAKCHDKMYIHFIYIVYTFCYIFAIYNVAKCDKTLHIDILKRYINLKKYSLRQQGVLNKRKLFNFYIENK